MGKKSREKIEARKFAVEKVSEEGPFYLSIHSLHGTNIGEGTAVRYDLYNSFGEKIYTVQEDAGIGFSDMGGGGASGGFRGDVDLILVTHTHNDHINGFTKLVDACKRNGKNPQVILGNEAYSVMAPVLMDNISVRKKRHELEGNKYDDEKRTIRRLFPGRIQENSSRKGAGKRQGKYWKEAEEIDSGTSYLPFRKIGNNEKIRFGPGGVHSVKAFAGPKGLEHLPGTRYYKLIFFEGTKNEISVSTLFDFYAESTGNRERDSKKQPFLRALSGSDALIIEGTTAYKTEGAKTRAEREQELVKTLAETVREGKKYIVLPAFAQGRAPSILDSIDAACELAGLDRGQYEINYLGKLSTNLITCEGSPYARHRPEIKKAQKKIGWKYGSDKGSNKIHFVVATSGFCLKNTASESHLGKALEIDKGVVILTSDYAPPSSPLREILDDTSPEGFLGTGKVRVVSQTGHPGPGGYSLAVDLARPKKGGALVLVHSGPEAIPSFTEIVSGQGHSPVPPLSAGQKYLLQSSPETCLYLGSRSETLVIGSDGARAQSSSLFVPETVRILSGMANSR